MAFWAVFGAFWFLGPLGSLLWGVQGPSGLKGLEVLGHKLVVGLGYILNTPF